MRRERKLMMLWVFLGLVAVAMVAGAASILTPGRLLDDRVFVSIFIVGIYALGAMALAAMGSRMRWSLRLAGVTLALSMCFYIFAVWFERLLPHFWENFVYRFAFVCMVIGLVFTHRMLICPLRCELAAGRIAKPAALASTLIFAALVVVGIVDQRLVWWGGLYMRLLGLSGIVAAGSSITAGAVALFGPRAGEDEPGLLGEAIGVRLSCPRCGEPIEARANRPTRCGSCRLKVRVEVEEPRCACGYLLYQLTGDTCPECGRGVREEDRWDSRASIQPA